MTPTDAATSTAADAPLFEINPGSYLLKVVPIGLAAGLWLLLIGGDFHRTLGIICLAAMPIGIVRWWISGRHTIACYRDRIRYRGRSLSYADFENLTVSIQDVRYEASRFRVYKFSFQGSNVEGPFHIRVRWLDRLGHSEAVDYMIRAASAPIVSRLEEELKRTGTAHWCRLATFGADSLTLLRSGRQIRYEDIVNAKLAEGFLRGELVVRCRDKSRITIGTKEENFYPGYYFLLTKIPVAASPEDLRADVFEQPVRRVHFLAAGGLLIVALAIASLPLLAPVDASGVQIFLGMAALCILGSAFFFWKAMRRPKPQ